MFYCTFLRTKLAMAMLLAGLLGGFLSPTVAHATDEASAKAELAEKGFRVTSSGIASEREAELRSSYKQVTKLRKALLSATRELAKMQGGSDQLRAQVTHLQQQRVQYSAKLAQLSASNSNNVKLNNQLVGALNAIEGQRQLLIGQQSVVDDELGKSRQSWSEAREDYLQLVLDMRAIADEIQELYDQHAEDDSLQKVVEQLNEATGKSYSLEPSRTFLSSIKRLEALEDDVLSESVDLRRQGNTLYATVVINGKYQKEMIVDSGASLICLPARVATDLGVEPDSDDPPIQLVMADGREIEGRLVTLDEVRVGKFIVEKVEAAVLGPEAINAEPLLGMSYLGNFKFELDAKAGTLDMVNIEGANPAEQKEKKSTSRRRQ
ncbi:MAG: TIGR02281 family clan AA aspartic protease [Aeoliella sp.]